MTFLSYAQNFEDVLLWRALRTEENGFYVDVGAAHPDEDSVTRAFYDRGWRGINVEPVPEFAALLAAARPRDINLAVAVGRQDGDATLYVVPRSGLSTTRADVAREAASLGFGHEEARVPLRTLAGVLGEHAPPTIHFLKVDVEGAEADVLAGCDFGLFRPWIVLVEATAPMSTTETHAGWEPILTGSRYRHILFDGLNRYYVAEERFERLSPHFRTPVNVFDDFRRAPARADADADRAAAWSAVSARAAVAEASARGAYARAFEAMRDLAEATCDLARAREAASAAARERDARIAALTAENHDLAARVAALGYDAAHANHLVRSMRSSTSWRVSAPIRMLGAAVTKATGRDRDASTEAAGRPDFDPGPDLGMPPSDTGPDTGPAVVPASEARRVGAPVEHRPRPPGPSPRTGLPLTAVHQFHSGSARGDAITAAMLLLRGLLRGMGYRSEIFVEHRDPSLKEELRLLGELPRHGDHVLILRHSMGHDSLDHILASPAPKVLLFHNITPPEFLAASPGMAEYARLGRRQLDLLRPHVVAALADSEYNAVELRSLGYAPVRACTLLFDLEALERRAAAARRSPGNRRDDRPCTVLFTGRVVESKAQAEVVEAYARFRAGMGRPCQLVLVGRTDGGGTYLAEVDAAMRRHGLEAEVVITGLASDEELDARFAEADLFLSLSHHEGFGVPLVEAIIQGIPVLAWPSGAVPYTLGEGGGLLDSRDPARVAARMLDVARNAATRAALVAAQRAAVARFALPRQLPALHEALALAGAVPPADPAAREALRANLHFTVLGHAAGSYSLAAVNRTLALNIEAERPGRVRLRPVEGDAIDDLSGVPEGVPNDERSRIARLVARGPAETGPEVVVSGHYPVHVPAAPGDLPLAFLFWEESLLPTETIRTLAEGFRAVLAPTASVAKALVDSGLPIPVRVTGHAPDLSAMEAVGCAGGDGPRAAGGPLTFLHVSSCFPRKGVDVLLRAYARAFRRSDPVRLVVKGFPNPHNTAAADVAALRATDPDAPAVEVVDRDLPEAKLLDLYRDADAMVLPTRGEGFNLPAAEAMAAGIPLIVTGHGGHMDFLDASCARLLRWHHAPSGSHLATPGSLWVEPDEDDLVAALRETALSLRAREGHATLAEKVRLARLRVARDLRRAPVVRRMEDAVLDVLLTPPPPPLRVAWITSWEVRCGVAEYGRQLLQAIPDYPGVASHVVLTDERWREDARPRDALGHAVRACWRIGDPASLPALEAAVSVEDPHAVVVQHQPGLMPWEVLSALLDSAALRGRTIVVTLHNTQHLLERDAPVRDAARDALARTDRVLVHTAADLERLRTLGLGANVAVIPHGVKAPVAAPALTGSPTPGAGPIIGCYGFFLPGKGIGELIRALAILRRTVPDVRLRLVNADYGVPESTAEIALCRAVAEEMGVAGAVEWHTEFLPAEEALAFLAGCAVVALPTQASKESSSASVRDALAAGPTVMVTPLPIFDDVGDAVVRAGGTDPASLAATLRAILGGTAPPTREATRIWLAARSWNLVAARLGGMLLGLTATRTLVSLASAPGNGEASQ